MRGIMACAPRERVSPEPASDVSSQDIYVDETDRCEKQRHFLDVRPGFFGVPKSEAKQMHLLYSDPRI